MPKGKKFDAAEKHFKKKEDVYQHRIRELETTVSQLKIDVKRLETEKGDLLSENNSLKEWVERLLSYTELSKEDIQAACERDKKRGEAVIAFTGMMKALHGYF